MIVAIFSGCSKGTSGDQTTTTPTQKPSDSSKPEESLEETSEFTGYPMEKWIPN
jgi:hypothetical protein